MTIKSFQEVLELEKEPVSNMKIFVLLSVFVSSIITANIIAGIKLTNLWGFIVPAGFLAYAVTFPVTDIIDEVYGRDLAQKFVWTGFIANLVSLTLIGVSYYMPPLTPQMQDLYSKALTPMLRIVIASLTAYLISQTHDVWAFMKWRKITNGKHLWIRNNASTMASQFIDTVIFITLAFYGVISNNVLLSMIWAQWIWKVIVAVFDTPFVYLGVKLFQNTNFPASEYGLIEVNRYE